MVVGVVLVASLAGCGERRAASAGTDTSVDGPASAALSADGPRLAAPDAPSPCATRPLTAADVAQYASVMHAAVDRWHHLPPNDRATLATAKSLEAQGSNPNAAALGAMSDELQRATELMTSMDRVVAREQHIPLECYDAIASRIETVVPDMGAGSAGDADDASDPVGGDPTRRQAALAQEHADSLAVGSRRAELQPLIHEVRLGHLAN